MSTREANNRPFFWKNRRSDGLLLGDGDGLDRHGAAWLATKSVARGLVKTNDLLQNVESLGDMTEGHVGALAVQVRNVGTGGEEILRSGRVRCASACHHKVALGVLEGAAFILDGVSDAVTCAETATLDDVDGGVGAENGGAVVVLVARQGDEVVHGAWHGLGIQSHNDGAL